MVYTSKAMTRILALIFRVQTMKSNYLNFNKLIYPLNMC